MRYIELKTLQTSGEWIFHAVCYLEGGAAICRSLTDEGKTLITNLQKDGVVVGLNSKRVFPADGQLFLDGLMQTFDNPSLLAEEKEGEPPSF